MVRRDYPLDEIEREVRRAGARPRRRSRWLHAVSVALDGAVLARIRRLPQLQHIQPVMQFIGRRPYAEGPVTAPSAAPALLQPDELYGPSAMPFRQLNLFPLVEEGLRGSGIRIAVLDTGFETEDAAFDSITIIAQRDFVFNDSIVRNEPADDPSASRHGTAVLSLLAANLPNQIIGVAPEAEYILAKTEDVRSETRVEEDNWVAAIEWADSIGTDIVSSSLAYLTFDDGFSYGFDALDGDNAVTTIAADSAVARGITVVAAVGNGGFQGFRTLVTPADADSVITVGAEDSLGMLATFSSRGPTFDGRLKPDIMAPGQSVFVVDPLSGSGFSRFSGTSFSTPLIAGTAALLLEIHPSLTPTEILDALRNTGDNRAEPDSLRGWGRPNAAASGTFPRGVTVTDPPAPLLQSVTPRFAWSADDVPPFGVPVSFDLRIATDTSFANVILDTTLTDTEVQFTDVFAPNQRFVFDLTATGANDVVFTVSPDTEYVAPEWVTLLNLNNPEGSFIRDQRPMLQWTSPNVTSPPGPFVYDIAVVRADNGRVEVEALGLSDTDFVPPRDLELNTPYRWRIAAQLGADTSVVESLGTFIIIDESIPTTTLLFQNFPNPFPNPTTGVSDTCIWFDLAEPGEVRLDILDIRGHVVRNLVPGDLFSDVLDAGRYGRAAAGSSGCDGRLEWDGTASDGRFVPRGIYPVRLKTPAGTFFKRIVYLGN